MMLMLKWCPLSSTSIWCNVVVTLASVCTHFNEIYQFKQYHNTNIFEEDENQYSLWFHENHIFDKFYNGAVSPSGSAI